MRAYRTRGGVLIEEGGVFFDSGFRSWDEWMSAGDWVEQGRRACHGKGVEMPPADQLLAPIGTQEVWAAGVTYYRSRSARMEESKDAGGGTFYDRVYSAARPELFFKASGHRVVGPGGMVRIRGDAKWSVPEPELTLVIDAAGKIVGYTIGNDMSSRDIEGENPLYLPQAKVYDGSCALGPCVLLAEEPLDRSVQIAIEINRGAQVVFAGKTTLDELKREPRQLVEFLYREMTFDRGAYLMTGTGVVPVDDFTLKSGDRVKINIRDIGLLENVVA